MTALLLALALAASAAPAGQPPDIAAEYKAAKERRDRAAAEVERLAKAVQDAGNDTASRLSAARQAERAQLALQAASEELNAVVRRMKPGDAIWVQETDVRATGGLRPGDDRYALQIPSPGEGAPVDPRMFLGGSGGPAVLHDRPPASLKEVSYGRPAGFANDILYDAQRQAAIIPPARRARERPRPPEPEEPVEPVPAEEGVPFQGPLPEEAADLLFVRLGEFTRFPALHRQNPGGGAFKLLEGVARDIDRGDLAGAWQGTRRLVERHPDDPGLRVLAATLALRLGRPEEAEAEAREALRLDEDDAQAWSVLSWALLRQGRRREAAAAARRAMGLSPAAPAAAAALSVLKASGAAPAAAPAATPAPAGPAAPWRRGRGLLATAAAAVASAALAGWAGLRLFRRRA